MRRALSSQKVATVLSIISLTDCEPKREPWRGPTGNVVSPVVCVNAAGKVGPRFPSRGTIHLQKFLEITSRAKAQWKRRRAGRQDERRVVDRRQAWRENGEREREREMGRERGGAREINHGIAFDIRRIGTTAVNLGADRNLRSENSVPVFERYINKLRFVFGKVEVVFDYDAIVRACDRWGLGEKEARKIRNASAGSSRAKFCGPRRDAFVIELQDNRKSE